MTLKNRDPLFLGLLISCCLLLIYLLILAYANRDVSTLFQAHPDFPQMLKSTNGQAEMSSGLLYFFGPLLLFVFFFVVMIGLSRPKRIDASRKFLTGYFLVYMILISVCLATYQGGSTNMFAGFPISTSWMLFGLGFYPILFGFVFYMKFSSWVFSEEDQQRFDELLANRRSN